MLRLLLKLLSFVTGQRLLTPEQAASQQLELNDLRSKQAALESLSSKLRGEMKRQQALARERRGQLGLDQCEAVQCADRADRGKGRGGHGGFGIVLRIGGIAAAEGRFHFQPRCDALQIEGCLHAAFGEALNDPRLIESLGVHLAHTAATIANVLAALSTGLFILRFRRPIAHLIRNQPLSRRLTRRALSDTIDILGTFWYVPALVLVGISLFATFVSAGDTSTALRQSLMCTVLVVVCMVLNGLVRRHAANPKRANKRQAVYTERLRNFAYALVHLFIWLLFIELGLRVWGLSMISFAEGDGHEVSLRLLGLAGTLIAAWLVWILADTAVHHALVRSRRGLANARAQTMMPLIRNVMFVAIFIIAVIVALANMGMNVTPLLAGAGVIGLAIGFGAQSLVADLITGLFIIIEDSLAIDDYVDVGGHLGTVEGLTIRTVRLRDIDGIVHTIPFSEIKSIKNYSREFGYAIFRVAIPHSMNIDQAITLIREVGQKLRNDPLMRRNIWSPLELQGVESFESGSAILRARFKTAPIKQWEVSRAFNLALKRQLDEAGLDLATPRLSVQVVTAGGGGMSEAGSSN